MASTQSGITASDSLLATWAGWLSDPTGRLLKIVIGSEEFVASDQREKVGSFEEDFSMLQELVSSTDPSYLIYRTDSSSFIFYSYVPDHAPVRQKMVYASSRATLLRNLGESRFESTLFSSDLSDLTFTSYFAHQNHTSSAAPLTIREQEMVDIKLAEAREQDYGSSSTTRKSMLNAGAGVGLEWTQDASKAVEELREEGSSRILVRLEIDTKKETVFLSDEQPGTLSIPRSLPSYTFYRHANGLVFIYSCPPTSPIKSRLLYSSSANGVVSTAKALGLSVLKKIELSSPEEIDDTYILEELGPLAEGSGISGERVTSPIPVADTKAFARPSRPGRKR